MNTFKAEDFDGCTIDECHDTADYLEACIKDYKKLHATSEMLYCMSHLSAIRQAILAKKR